eukprot:Platyproteum_vivax@DN7057_c0_g1_i2.p1
MLELSRGGLLSVTFRLFVESFIQRNGVSVASVVGGRPLDLFKRHHSKFLILGGGNVSIPEYITHPDVEALLTHHRGGTSSGGRSNDIGKSVRKDRGSTSLPDASNSANAKLDEKTVVDEFRRLILSDESKTVYISSLCGRFLQKYGQPVSTIITSRPADFLRNYPDVFVMTGGGNVGLREVLGDVESVPPPPPREFKKKGDGLEKSEKEKRGVALLRQVNLDDDMYNEIHKFIISTTYVEEVRTAVDALANILLNKSFLAVESVAIGGCIGEELASLKYSAASFVLFVHQVPLSDHSLWLRPILETLLSVLEIRVPREQSAQWVIRKDVIHFVLNGHILVNLRVLGVYPSVATVIDMMKAAPPTERFYFDGALIKERTILIGKQPDMAKAAMRLMLLWRTKSVWNKTPPDDYLLQLVVMHAYYSTLPKGDTSLEKLVETCFSLLSTFESLSVTWEESNLRTYHISSVKPSMLSVKPLILDPINPTKNVADSGLFDCVELMTLAASPSNCDVFKREVTKLPHMVLSLEKRALDCAASRYSSIKSDNLTPSPHGMGGIHSPGYSANASIPTPRDTEERGKLVSEVDDWLEGKGEELVAVDLSKEYCKSDVLEVKMAHAGGVTKSTD